MPSRAVIAAIFVCFVCRYAAADEKYTFHENVHVGEKTTVVVENDYKVKSTSTINGTSTVTDTRNYENWKLNLTVLEQKDGSATRSQLDVAPESYDITREGENEKKSPCPYAGKTVIVSRLADESFTNNFQGDAEADDTNMINAFISPDADFFPDHPVAIAEMWDASAKVSRHSQLSPGDQLLCRCRLDWVKTIGSKQMAQISCSQANIYQEDGNVEEDDEITSTLLVDVAAGMIVKCDQKGTGKYITNPKEKTQVGGGMEFSFHCEVLPSAPAVPPAKSQE
jgi:hypothetical protein